MLHFLASKKPIRKMTELDPALFKNINDYRLARARFRDSNGHSKKQRKIRKLAIIEAERRLVHLLNARAKSEGKYLVAPMNPKFIGEDLTKSSWSSGAVEYYETIAEWKSYRLKVDNGKIYDSSGKLFDTEDAEQTDKEMPSYWERDHGKAIFVMDRDGNLYADKFPVARFHHHSSLVAGTPCASAGELEVKKGVLTQINSKTNHYGFPRFLNEQVLTRLKAAGVEIRPTMVDFWDARH